MPRPTRRIVLPALALSLALVAAGARAQEPEPQGAQPADGAPPLAPGEPPAARGLAPESGLRAPAPVDAEDIPMSPARARLELHRGQRLLDDGLGAPAAVHFERVIAEQPGLPAPHLLLAQALSVQGRPVEAAEAARRAAALVAALPDVQRRAAGEPRYLLALGRAEAAISQLAAAEAAFRRATELAPADAAAHLELGTVLLRRGADAEAEAALARAVALAPDRADARLQHGNALLRLDRIDEARAELERATALAPGSADAWYSLASVHRASGDDAAQASALERFESLRSTEQERATRDGAIDALLREAAAAADEGRLQDAVGKLEAAAADAHVAERGYRRRMVLARLARARALAGDVAGAEADYARALEAAPGDPVASYELGTLLVEQGRFDEAMPHLLQAVEADPFAPAAHVNLGLCWAQLGRLNEALAEITKATTLDPDDLAVRQLYVNVLWAIGERARAEGLAAAGGVLSPALPEAHRPPAATRAAGTPEGAAGWAR